MHHGHRRYKHFTLRLQIMWSDPNAGEKCPRDSHVSAHCWRELVMKVWLCLCCSHFTETKSAVRKCHMCSVWQTQSFVFMCVCAVWRAPPFLVQLFTCFFFHGQNEFVMNEDDIESEAVWLDSGFLYLTLCFSTLWTLCDCCCDAPLWCFTLSCFTLDCFHQSLWSSLMNTSGPFH